MSPTKLQYVGTYEVPESIYNAVHFICKHLRETTIKETSVNSLLTYDLKYACPSSRYVSIINSELEERAIAWRIHSMHALLPELKCKIIIRRTSLLDLTGDAIAVPEHEQWLHHIMHKFNARMGKPLVSTGSYVAVSTYKIANDTEYLFTYVRDFDTYEYDTGIPEATWKRIDGPAEAHYGS